MIIHKNKDLDLLWLEVIRGARSTYRTIQAIMLEAKEGKHLTEEALERAKKKRIG